MSFLPHHSIANIITLSNITFGTLSLLHSIRGHYTTAAAFILIAVFLDGMDGRVARRLSVSSELGKQLDSLCDLVSFGVAPAFLIYLQYTVVYSFEFGVVLTLYFVLCGAYRLARFNILGITDYFLGIPITLAGALMALMALLGNFLSLTMIGIVTFILATLMISNIKVTKFK